MKKLPTFNEEILLWKKGYDFVVGLDEVGRGCFAGPVVVGGSMFTKNFDIKLIEKLGINDSKLLKSKKREELAKEIIKFSNYEISEIEVSTINKIGIGKATELAFKKTIQSFIKKFQNKKIFFLIDGLPIRNFSFKHKAIIKGDQKSISIASASIIAKVYRDKLMTNLNNLYPNYNFKTNKGYGTKNHRDALFKYGLSKIHRTSFNLNKFLPTV